MTQSLLSAPIAAIADHLWQSTLFALAAVMMTLMLRSNAARVRYRLWLAASLKFLVPFWLLVSAGSRFSGRYLPAHRSLFATARAVGEPFTVYVTVTAHPAAHIYLPKLLGLVWFFGFAVILAAWCLRWRRVSMETLRASCVTGGRELAALRAVEPTTAGERPMPLLLSPSAGEPGVFGIVRPLLLWPAAISERLDDVQLRAIMAHEIAHVRRRDNLFAAIHMLVEAVFWFHPLVWWLGLRMMDERERACDEAVLQQGHLPRVYAESILKTCEFCVGSPVACISGVTGANLKERMVRIMNPQPIKRLSWARKVILGTLGVAVVAGPVLLGLLSTPAVTAQSQSDAAQHVYHVGGEVVAPKLVFAPDPEFSGEAKRKKYQGVCVLTLVVDAQGNPQHIQVRRALKYGLDEKAIEAVKRYKFTPATLHGQPVAVEVNIEVNFRFY